VKQLSKGMTFDVVSQSFADVILAVEGQKMLVSRQDVRLFDKQPPAQSVVPGFTPGQLIIHSAKYSLEGNQARNVKNRLQKYLPENGMLTAPVSFAITDDLSTAATNQKQLVIETPGPGVIIVPSSETKDEKGRPKKMVIVPQTQVTVVPTAPNVLTVEYTFSGMRRAKTGIEGQMMTLP